MFHHNFFCRIFTSAASASVKGIWDPTITLRLNHPFLVILETCTTREHFKQILAQMMRVHLIFQTFPMSRALHFSALSHPESLDIAIVLFNHFTPVPNLYIYNTMLRALSFSSNLSISCYKSMVYSCIFPNEQSLLALLKSQWTLSEAKQIHGHAVVTGVCSSIYVQNSFIKIYSENREMSLAYEMFQRMQSRDISSFNIMIMGLARNGYILAALDTFHSLVLSGYELDHFTVLVLLLCCGQLRDSSKGKSVHAWLLRRIPVNDWGLILCNALLNMYAKVNEMDIALRFFERLEKKDAVSWNTMIARFMDCGNPTLALWLFNQMPNKDLVSWNSLLSGYAQNGNWSMALRVFTDMLSYDINPDKVSMVSLISAAAEAGLLYHGRALHGWLFRHIMTFDAFMGSALIDMYCKCGSVDRGSVVFGNISRKDVVLWTAIISGLACHGHGAVALELFDKMQEDGVMPNELTLIAVLNACSHAGLVDRGCTIFEAIKKDYGINPTVEHYGCLVDLLTRAGRLTDAKEVIQKMPMRPSCSVWGAILAACKAQGDLGFAQVASTELLKLEPEEESGYVLLSNIHAADGNWKYSVNIRGTMNSRGVKKMAGRSVVYVDGLAHQFTASDGDHPMLEMIYCMLVKLNREMKCDIIYCYWSFVPIWTLLSLVQDSSVGCHLPFHHCTG